MKKIVLIIITIIAFISFIVNAETEEIVIQDQTLKEACDDFGLTCNHTQQDVNPLLPNLYVFIGDECSYCGELLVFLSLLILFSTIFIWPLLRIYALNFSMNRI